ncbi:hypothetical protein PsorP6_018086 [Peronosclerospora sorghi]|uniref:Uncharacterized protein n=1 Tax=Peronosclerospora sorghi TaxID=230839 RepID=A0ACC0WBX3_9STRA|nr:hypothetical protein PsorP6_018086 [Peronosclerospora sorghi]
MERKDLKRKALEPLLVSEKITALTCELKENDALLRHEIQDLQDEISRLKTQLESVRDEATRWKARAAFLHPDAVVDRVRMKLWHHGDLSLLRRAIEPTTRTLRHLDTRSDRSLYLCDSAPRKVGCKPRVMDSRASDVSPKPEHADECMTEATELVADPSNGDNEKDVEEEEEVVSASSVSGDDAPTNALLLQTVPSDVLICRPE